MWEKIIVEYNKKKSNGSEICPAKGVKNRYNTFAKELTKFYNFYKHVNRLQESLTNEDDKILKAKARYKQAKNHDSEFFEV